MLKKLLNFLKLFYKTRTCRNRHKIITTQFYSSIKLGNFRIPWNTNCYLKFYLHDTYTNPMYVQLRGFQGIEICLQSFRFLLSIKNLWNGSIFFVSSFSFYIYFFYVKHFLNLPKHTNQCFLTLAKQLLTRKLFSFMYPFG